MTKIIGAILALLVSFSGGYLLASWNFVYTDTYVLKEPIAIVADGIESGVLPMAQNFITNHLHTMKLIFMCLLEFR